MSMNNQSYYKYNFKAMDLSHIEGQKPINLPEIKNRNPQYDSNVK